MSLGKFGEKRMYRNWPRKASEGGLIGEKSVIGGIPGYLVCCVSYWIPSNKDLSSYNALSNCSKSIKCKSPKMWVSSYLLKMGCPVFPVVDSQTGYPVCVTPSYSLPPSPQSFPTSLMLTPTTSLEYWLSQGVLWDQAVHWWVDPGEMRLNTGAQTEWAASATLALDASLVPCNGDPSVGAASDTCRGEEHLGEGPDIVELSGYNKEQEV